MFSVVQNADESEQNDLIAFISITDEEKSFIEYLSDKYLREDKLDKVDMKSFYKIITTYFDVFYKKRSQTLIIKEGLEKTLDF